jgi:hypothetical protein
MGEIRDIVQPEAVGLNGAEVIPYEAVDQFQGGVPENDQEAAAGGPDDNWRFWQSQINAAMVAERRFRKGRQQSGYFARGRSCSTDSSEAPIRTRSRKKPR